MTYHREPTARDRIAAEMRAKLRGTDPNDADPTGNRERQATAERYAQRDADQLAAWQAAAAAALSPRMAPNRAQGSSHAGRVVEAQPTGATPLDRIRAITHAKIDSALLPNNH